MFREGGLQDSAGNLGLAATWGPCHYHNMAAESMKKTIEIKSEKIVQYAGPGSMKQSRINTVEHFSPDFCYALRPARLAELF